MGILGGQKIKSPGNVLNCPDNQYNLFFLTHPTLGGSGGGVGGQHFKSPVNFMNCRENRYKNPPSTKGGRSWNFRGSKNQKSGKCHELPRKVIKQINPTPPNQGLGVLKGKTFLLAPPTPSDGGGGLGAKI